jgi:acyl transferase domain-containing protein/thioesterase domain-containing protein/acyl carrier protein
MVDEGDMTEQEIAIIGLAGRFPGAQSIDEFWQNLKDGVESVQVFAEADLLARGVPAVELANPAYVRAGAVLDGIDQFDADFFGFSPRDAAIMDPQHRHFLECAWEALEQAGHNPENFSGSIGVYAGSGMSAYLLHNLLTNRQLVQSAGLFLIRQTGNDKDVLATRVSYQLNLRGPSVNVQTACSSSLVAIHMACQSLLNHECDMALAGGVTIEIPHGVGYIYREGEILSQDGHCRSFDARSTGTVFGSGLGIVVLRRLQEAIKDGDHIHAVVLGSAINNDGSRKVGYLAPSVEGQAEVIAEALAAAGVDATSISYVETHGTGTRVGDPIEISGLTQAFREFTRDKQFCAIGSVKSNIGHLDTAAGVAGLIKTVLALEHGQIPPSLHFEKPNPHIDLANSPFYVNRDLQAWKSNGVPRRAGVTSLGIGGTNAHVILEEAPAVERVRIHRPWNLLTLSARSLVGLDAAGVALARHLEEHPELDVADVSFTCQLGRKAFKHRRALVCRSAQEAIDGLRVVDPRQLSTADAGTGDREVVFLFPGQGSQYVNMGLELYQVEPEFRQRIDECSELLRPHLGLELRTVLYPLEQEVEEHRLQLYQTWLTQPALFTIEYALAKLWISWGIQPRAMAGHSIGEYVAACIAGVFPLDAALAIVATRARLMQSLPPGAMTVTPLSEPEMRSLIGGDISLAAVNGPRQCVASGPVEAIEELEQTLRSREISCRRLHTSHAFHSQMTEPILEPLTDAVRRFRRTAPLIPYLSNVTGGWMTAAEAEDPEYWAKQLRGTVRFADSLEELFRVPGRLLLEVGPGQTLSALARQHPGRPKEQRAFQSMRHATDPASDLQVLLTTLGQLWTAGTRVDWRAFREHDRGYRTPLPTYPFERQRYWIEPEKRDLVAVQDAAPHRSALAQWFYRPTWKRVSRASSENYDSARSQHWLIFTDEFLGPVIRKQLRRTGHTVTAVTAGRRFSAGDTKYTIRPGNPDDYSSLIADLVLKHRAPSQIVHLWALDAPSGLETLDESQNASFYSLLFLARALGERELTDLQLTVISDRMQRVADEPSLHPETATLLGPCKVIPKEYPGILCCSLDVSLAGKDYAGVAQQVIDEAMAAPSEPVVAYRGDDRWLQTFEPVTIDSSSGKPRLRDRGIYLITGGLGGLGLTVAGRLAKEVHARLVLTSRKQFPPRDDWEVWLKAHDAHPLSHRIRMIQQLEDAGAEVQVVCADVANREQMRAAIDVGRKRFGRIDGVIHAAGVLDDGLIQFKTRQKADAVLEPKLKGTLVLDELLKGSSLDFMVPFSSISSIAPPAGQVDYAAANAFLDAFARSKPANSHTLTTAINWTLWRDVGMGMRDRAGTRRLQPIQDHPLLGTCTTDPSGVMVYSRKLNCQTHWILDHHRIRDGKAVFPGTGYLEMAAAALASGAPERPLELRDVFFAAPFAFDPHETREVRFRVGDGPTGGRFSVASVDMATGEWEEYASGTWRRSESSQLTSRSLEQLIARCNVREVVFPDDQTKQEKYFTFGRRWRSLQRIHIGTGEAVSVLELPAEFQGDLDEYRVHPALFDIATGSALYLIRGYESSDDMYLPLGYREVTIWGRLPGRIYSHIRVTGDNVGAGEVSTFDALILDAAGTPLISIAGFALRRISDGRLPSRRANSHAAGRQSTAETAWDQEGRDAISPSEGGEALLRILSKTDIGPEVVVSPQNLSPLLKPAGDDTPTTNVPVQASSRLPESKGAPRDKVEQVLIGWWNELLGTNQISVDDDFFDLGGHSLIAVQLFSKIRKTYGLDLDLSLLFEARTVARLAEAIRNALDQRNGPTATLPKRWTSLVPIQPSGTLPPFYFVSGAGGHVLLFQTLSKHLGPEQPVYALQPPGLDGKQPFFTRIEDIAGYYLREIKAVQPVGPYHLAGYSFGGIVTFEMAQQLRANGEDVGLLALLDSELRFWEFAQESLSVTNRLKHWASRLTFFLAGPAGPAHLWGAMRIKSHRALLRAFRTVGRPLPRVMGDIQDANWFAAANYKPKVYRGKLVLVRCSEVSVSDRGGPLLGWGELAAGIDVREIPGNHDTIVKEPNVGHLAAALRLCMRDSLATRSQAHDPPSERNAEYSHVSNPQIAGEND